MNPNYFCVQTTLTLTEGDISHTVNTLRIEIFHVVIYWLPGLLHHLDILLSYYSIT
jgi:hypothetical protein